MKKALIFLLALVLLLSLCACGETESKDNAEKNPTETEAPSKESAMTKEEMLSSASPLTREELDKSITNIAFAKGLTGNIYTFDGEIWSVEEDHAVITFHIQNYATVANVMVANLYLPLDELPSLEYKQRFSFVGQLDDVTTHEESFPEWGTDTVVDMIFKNVAVVSDRFEESGKLDSPNQSYGNNSWNVKYPDSDVLKLVYFTDDVSEYKGKNVTFSFRYIDDKRVDAYIVSVEESVEPTIEERLEKFSFEDREFFLDYVKTEGLEQMVEDEITALLTDNSFGMRNNYGGDVDGNHTIAFHGDGSVDARYTSSDGKEYTMYESWRIENGLVIMQHTFKNNFGETKTHDYNFEVYRFDDTRILLLCYENDCSMLLTVK